MAYNVIGIAMLNIIKTIVLQNYFLLICVFFSIGLIVLLFVHVCVHVFVYLWQIFVLNFSGILLCSAVHYHII